MMNTKNPHGVREDFLVFVSLLAKLYVPIQGSMAKRRWAEADSGMSRK
jgi:hypothetical protein